MSRADRWPALERDNALQLATIPAPRGPADPAGFAPGQIPVNDDTAPGADLVQLARAGIDHIKALNGRTKERSNVPA